MNKYNNMKKVLITGGAGTIGTPTAGGPGGVGMQAPADFRDPTNPYGTPGPSAGGFYFSGGGAAGVTQDGGSNTGGAGGGGNSATPTVNGNAPANTGGGGGGGNGPGSPNTGGDGADGIVLIAYSA